MKPADNIERSIKDLRIKTTAALDGRILTDALAALEPSGPATSEAQPATRPGRMTRIAHRAFWRAIMASKWSQIGTAAAAIVVAVAITLTVLHQSARPAYALEQTIEANRGLRYLHIRNGPPEAVLSETWAQIAENGEVLRLKMEFPLTQDGPKVVVWAGDKAEVWFKAKRVVGVFRDPKTAAGFPDMLKAFEPTRVVEELYQAQAKGRVSIDTQMPAASGEPIILTATWLPKFGKRTVYLMDAQTKLLTAAGGIRVGWHAVPAGVAVGLPGLQPGAGRRCVRPWGPG